MSLLIFTDHHQQTRFVWQCDHCHVTAVASDHFYMGEHRRPASRGSRPSTAPKKYGASIPSPDDDLCPNCFAIHKFNEHNKGLAQKWAEESQKVGKELCTHHNTRAIEPDRRGNTIQCTECKMVGCSGKGTPGFDWSEQRPDDYQRFPKIDFKFHGAETGRVYRNDAIGKIASEMAQKMAEEQLALVREAVEAHVWRHLATDDLITMRDRAAEELKKRGVEG